LLAAGQPDSTSARNQYQPRTYLHGNGVNSLAFWWTPWLAKPENAAAEYFDSIISAGDDGTRTAA